MATKARAGIEELVQQVQATLNLVTKAEAEKLVNVFISCLEEVLVHHLAEGGYYLKLNGFGKFTVHYRPPTRRKIGFTGEVREIPAKRKVRFVGIGRLRKLERFS